jgi:hypothetical protein
MALTRSLQTADSAAIDSVFVTWTNSLHWEVTAMDDDARMLCTALLRACPAEVQQAAVK